MKRSHLEAPAGRWRLALLLDAPHRLGFAAAALVLALSGLWWAAVIGGRTFGREPAWAVAPTLAHGLLFGFGFMPLFFTGFLFTAGPRWLQVPPVATRALLVPVSACLGGWLAFVLGAHLNTRLAAAGLAVAALGFGRITLHFLRLLRASRAEDRLHPRVIAGGCVVVCAALALAALGLAAGEPLLARLALYAGLWGGIALVHFTALHRMVPFFGSAAPLLDAWRPTWLLALLGTAFALEAAGAAAGLAWWPLPAGWHLAQAAFEAPLALLLLGLALRWLALQPVAQLRLVAMLYTGFVWLGLAFALQAVAHALQAGGDAAGLGLAPLHALAMGFLGSTFLAMVTRVSSGQAGLTIAADAVLWRLFWLLQLATLARLVGALWPAAAPLALPLAASAWAACMLAWALRYGRWYGRARIDRRAR